MLGVGKHGVFLFGNPHPLKFARQVGEVGHFDGGDIVEIAGIVGVAADAIGDLADPAGDIVDGLIETLPQARNEGAFVFVGAAFADTGNELGFAGLETRGLEMIECG